nr:hypothetical protein CFP56_04605 [Quercus suber]
MAIRLGLRDQNLAMCASLPDGVVTSLLHDATHMSTATERDGESSAHDGSPTFSATAWFASIKSLRSQINIERVVRRLYHVLAQSRNGPSRSERRHRCRGHGRNAGLWYGGRSGKGWLSTGLINDKTAFGIPGRDGYTIALANEPADRFENEV